MNLPHREVMRVEGLLVLTYRAIRCQSRLHREPEGLLGRNGDEGVKVRGTVWLCDAQFWAQDF